MSDPKCTSAQNFCKSCQTGIENLGTNINITIPMKDAYYNNKVIADAKNILQKLHDYGKLGDRDYPSQSNIDSVSIPNQYNITFADEYNKILNIIGASQISAGTEIITPNMAQQIQNYLKSYKIDYNRCNDCNTSNNCAQCDCDCHTSSCDCCMYGGSNADAGCHTSGDCCDRQMSTWP